MVPTVREDTFTCKSDLRLGTTRTKQSLINTIGNSEDTLLLQGFETMQLATAKSS